MSTPQSTAGPDLADALDAATTIVAAAVTNNADGTSTLRVLDTLVGPEVDTLVTAASSPWQADAPHGLCVLDSASNLLWFAGTVENARVVLRALAGLEPLEPLPGPAELAELAAWSDHVTWVQVDSDGDGPCHATRLGNLVGSVPNHFDIVAGPQPERVGGPWVFEPGRSTRGVVFLTEIDGAYVATNPTHPGRYHPGDVEAALRRYPISGDR